MRVPCGHIIPIFDLYASSVGVHFYLKRICGELFFSNRTFSIFGFIKINEEHLLYTFTFFSSRIYIWGLSGTLIPVNYPEKSIMGPILNIVIINLSFTTLYQVQINTMSNKCNIKPIFSSFCTI